MSSETTKPVYSSLKEAVELFSKALAAMTGFVYLLGFLIIQLYLWIYDYVSFELLNVQYLLVGIMALLVPTGTLVLFLYFAANYAKPSRGRWTRIVLVLMIIGFLLACFVSPMISGGQPAFRNSNLIVGLSGFFLVFGPTILGWLYYSNFPALPSSRSFIFVTITAFSIMGILLYSFSYAVYKYRYVQPFLGGGTPRYAKLVIDSSAVPGFTDAGVDVAVETNLSEVVKIIYVSKDEYLLEPCTSYFENAIIIPKDLVKAVRTGQTCAALSLPEQTPNQPILP